MPYQETNIEGVFLFVPSIFEDSRGIFFESFRANECLRETGLSFEVKQVNNSRSRRGALRGIHFKKSPPGQAKFVSVTQGRILDLAIDLRQSSETFGQWQAFELSGENKHSLLLGDGIGHAFLALEDNSNVVYLCDSEFEPENEFGIHPLRAGVDWQQLADPFGILDFVLSKRDSTAPSLKDAQQLLFK